MYRSLIFSLLFLSNAWAQNLERSCLSDEDQGNGLDLAVDAFGLVHMSRVGRGTQNLLYTRIQADGSSIDEVVAEQMSELFFEEVEDTGILLEGGRVYICYHDVFQQEMRVATRENDLWSLSTVESYSSGSSCDLGLYQGELVVAYESAGVLKLGTLTGGSWNLSLADEVPGDRVGFQPSIALSPQGELVVAHRNLSQKELRIARWDGNQWSAQVPPNAWNEGGRQPAAFYDGDELRVYHGSDPETPNSSSDADLLVTEGLLNPSTLRIAEENVGGTLDATRSGGISTVVTRFRLRSALFGDQDGLRMLRGEDSLSPSALEFSGAGGQRHLYLFLRVAHDPFDLPVVAFLDKASNWGGTPASAHVCYYRPVDEDQDRLPDEIELQMGTIPDNADSDGDGRSDGEEVLLDGTDPLDGGKSLGDWDFCDDGHCLTGEGDCDADVHCQGELICGENNGPRFSLKISLDVCWPAHCQNGVIDGDELLIDFGGSCDDCFDQGLGAYDSCSTRCACSQGGGDCDADSHCQGDLICGQDNGARFQLPRFLDVCWPNHCENGLMDEDETGIDLGGSCALCNSQAGNYDHCSSYCPCPQGEGDCDIDSHCQVGLVCGVNNGARFAFSNSLDICWPEHCENGSMDGDEVGVDLGGSCDDCFEGENGDYSFCSARCPCTEGEGDCNADSHCQGELLCGIANSGRFGLPSGRDVCWPAHCQNGTMDGDEIGVDRGGSCGLCSGSNGGWAYCNSDCPCAEGEGDCDQDSDCLIGLSCSGDGSDYGLRSGIDVCIPF